MSEKIVSSLKVVGLCKKYSGKEVVRGVDLEANGGEVVGLLGPNGAGKSTMFNMMTMDLKRSDGEVKLLGRDLD